jgi:hypothetical protein
MQGEVGRGYGLGAPMGSTAIGKMSRAIAVRVAAVEPAGLWGPLIAGLLIAGLLIAGSMNRIQFRSHAKKADCHRDERNHARRRCP